MNLNHILNQNINITYSTELNQSESNQNKSEKIKKLESLTNTQAQIIEKQSELLLQKERQLDLKNNTITNQENIINTLTGTVEKLNNLVSQLSNFDEGSRVVRNRHVSKGYANTKPYAKTLYRPRKKVDISVLDSVIKFLENPNDGAIDEIFPLKGAILIPNELERDDNLLELAKEVEDIMVKRRYLTVELLKRGYSANKIVEIFGIGNRTVYDWKYKYQKHGIDGLQ